MPLKTPLDFTRRQSTTSQASPTALPTPISTYKSRKHPKTNYDPNAGRPADYPSIWQVVVNKRTAKCKLCQDKLSESDYAVQCTDCEHRICKPCWNGTRHTPDGIELFIEGKDRNDNGCWCHDGDTSRPPTRLRPLLDARNARIKNLPKATAATAATGPATRDHSAGTPDRGERDEAEETDNEHAKSDEVDEEALDADDEANEEGNGLFVQDNTTKSGSPPDDDDWDSLNGTIATESSPAGSVTDDVLEDDSEDEPHPLSGKTTVIVGAGIIGMSIALELALSMKEYGIHDHRVIVVEARESYGQLASGSCAGIFKAAQVPERYRSLSNLSQKYWDALVDGDKGIHVGHKASSLRDAWIDDPVPARNSGWYEQNGIERDGVEVAEFDIERIDTTKYLRMLHRICLRLGVDFRFQSQVTDIYMQRARCYIEDVEISAAHPRIGYRGTPELVSCQNLIIAAGAFTTWILHDLFPTETELLENWVDEYNDVYGKPWRKGKNEHLSLGRVLDGFKLTSTADLKLMPTIEQIPWDVLGSINGRDSPLGIHMCYGFGRYGTAMAPGAAKVIVRRMFGEPTGIDDAEYRVSWAQIAMVMELRRQDQE